MFKENMNIIIIFKSLGSLVDNYCCLAKYIRLTYLIKLHFSNN